MIRSNLPFNIKFLLLILVLTLEGCTSKKNNIISGYIEGEFRLLSSIESGVVVKTHVSRGDFVNKDALLSEIEFTGAKLSIERAEAVFELAKADFNRAKVLYRDGVLPKSSFEKIAATFEAADADYQQARWHLNRHSIKAPEDGFIQSILRNTGELATPQNPVIYFLPQRGVKARFFVNQPDLGKIKIGQRIIITVDELVKPFNGVIKFISNEAEFNPPIIYSNQSRSKLVFMVEAEIDFGSSQRLLKPGQPVEIEIKYEDE